MKRPEFYTVKMNSVDVSLKAKDYTTPATPMALTAGQFMHVGYYKPFRQMYLDFGVLNTIAVTVTFEYFNGVSFVPLTTAIDETEQLLKSGFIYWERPIDWTETTIDGDKQYYMRVSASLDLDVLTTLKGLNVLFSNDSDLIGIRSNIVSKHNNGNSWVEKHEAARKYIIQQMRNLGQRKIKVDELNPLTLTQKKDDIAYSDLTQFDLFDPFELREAAKFFALSYIYLDELSDEQDDRWERAGLRHERRANEALNVFMLRIDIDDDGVESTMENEGGTGTDLTWV